MTKEQVIALQAYILAVVEHKTACVHNQQRVTLQQMIEAQAHMIEVFTQSSEQQGED